jgi:hypothetical protein
MLLRMLWPNAYKPAAPSWSRIFKLDSDVIQERRSREDSTHGFAYAFVSPIHDYAS